MLQNRIRVPRTAALKICMWGSVLWASAVLGAALFAAPAVRTLSAGSTVVVGFGPIQLMRVTKTAVTGDDGFTLAFGLEGGIFVLGIVCMAVEAALVVLAPRLIHRYIQKSTGHTGKK